MTTWHMIIDVTRRHDCNNCFLADKDEFVRHEGPAASEYSAAGGGGPRARAVP